MIESENFNRFVDNLNKQNPSVAGLLNYEDLYLRNLIWRVANQQLTPDELIDILRYQDQIQTILTPKTEERVKRMMVNTKE